LLTRIGKVMAMAAVGLLATAGPALAHSDDGAIDNAKATHGHDAQHDGPDGHLPPVDSESVELVSKLELSNVEEGGIADVAVFGDYAYLAAWGGETCADTGIHVVDVSDVENPVEVGFIPAPAGSYPGEGVDVVTIDTPQFTGDVLLTNNEICDEATGFGGINLYDVTDPLNPQPLAEGFGDFDDPQNPQMTAHQTHSVFAWDAGDKAYAVMVDNEEAEDVDIVDITNPKKPVLIAEYDLAAEFPDILQPDQGLDEVFFHDVIVKEIEGRWVMLASYWDAGYVQLDVTDPLAPEHLADSDFADPDPVSGEAPEGNAHQAEFTPDNQFVIGADEDFNPYAITATYGDAANELDVISGDLTPPLEPGQVLTGETVYAGRACPGDEAVPAGDGTQIAVVERGVCTFTEKVAAVEAAGGYVAVLVFNREGADGCNATLGMSVEGNIPAFGVAPREQGFALFGEPFDEAACLAGDGSAIAPITIGTIGETVTFTSYFDGWGYVRLFDAETMTEIDQYAIPESQDPEFAFGFGDLSVHEVAVSQAYEGVAYLSYYSGGLRVIKVSEAGIEEVGSFIDEGGNNFWGVEVFEQDGVEYAALSDRDFGLYIFKYTP
jgi:hypothetical protein